MNNAFERFLRIVGFIILILVIIGYIGAVIFGIGWAFGELLKCIYTGPALIVIVVIIWMIDVGVRNEKRKK
jgi:Na+/proline symporter